jgi:hypothetical protein
MVCEEGEIDIIAEAFAFSVIDEIPFIPPHKSVLQGKMTRKKNLRANSVNMRRWSARFVAKEKLRSQK